VPVEHRVFPERHERRSRKALIVVRFLFLGKHYNFPGNNAVNQRFSRGKCGAISAAKAAVSGEQELAQNPQVVSDMLYNSWHFQPALLARKSRGGH
jgi:hypothetical protein